MATRRRIGVSIATTEAARRQLMQPVPCYEKVWVTPSGVSMGPSSIKVYKWVKTDKVQQFSDDEGEVDEPLAPLPDEPEVVDGDDDEQDETRAENVPTKEGELDTNQDEPLSKLPSPKLDTQPLLMATSSGLDMNDPSDNNLVDNSLKLDTGLEDGGHLEGAGGDLELDISGLGPDGLQLEGADDLSQLDGPDSLMGGPLMDQEADPFGPSTQ